MWGWQLHRVQLSWSWTRPYEYRIHNIGARRYDFSSFTSYHFPALPNYFLFQIIWLWIYLKLFFSNKKYNIKPYIRKWRRTKEPLDESERGKWKCWLKTQRSENQDHGIQSHHFMTNRWGNSGNSDRLYFLGLQNHCRWLLQPWNQKTLAPWKNGCDQPRQHIEKQRH